MAGLHYDYVIVGACRAGLSCAEAIRGRDPDGSLLIVSAESSLPYKRTKLSKKLHDGYGSDDFLLQPSNWYREAGIHLYLDAPAVDLAPDIGTLFLADGRKISYGRLCLATGARPRALPGEATEGVRYLREKEDGRRLRETASSWESVALIGTGIQSVELAEQFAKLGKRVGIFGPSPRLLRARVDARVSGMVEEKLRAHGIELHHGGGYSVADLVSEYDGVVASIGVEPAIGWLSGSGVELRRGVVIDAQCRTSVEDVFAAGDIAEPVRPFTSGLWHNAEYQGEIAGRVMSGEDVRLEQRAFRLKLDLFDEHYYALWYTPSLEGEPGVAEVELDPRPGIRYCRLFERNGSLAAALFSGDQALGKQIITPMAEEGAPASEVAAALHAASTGVGRR